MTFITSETKFWALIAWGLFAVCLIGVSIIAGENTKPQAAKNRVPSLPTIEGVRNETPPPAPPKDEAKPPVPELPYYGTTVFEGQVTSVYYYPQGPSSSPGASQTHIKFDHHEEDPEKIYLCGDQRKSFEVAHRYGLIVTFEPNTECASNWRIK